MLSSHRLRRILSTKKQMTGAPLSEPFPPILSVNQPQTLYSLPSLSSQVPLRTMTYTIYGFEVSLFFLSLSTRPTNIPPLEVAID